ncbi:FkbM family methyltransferase [Rhizobium sp. YIM 134829]|uniref:FkbM family methyltransferase n=1 Tax=Rhizobium sp. YIM 134829 TaxID=3390453 RepID=UPI003979EACB
MQTARQLDLPEGAHRGRRFARCPNAEQSIALLHEINRGQCRFAPTRPTRPLVLYGAGNLGRLARDHLRSVGLDFAIVVDRQAERISAEQAWAGVRVVAPDAVPDSVKAESLLAVSIAQSAYLPLELELMADGWRHVVPFYDLAESFRDRHPLSNGWFAEPLAPHEIEATETVLARWSDDLSRAHHLQFLAWRRLREEWTFEGAPVSQCVRFFIPEILTRLGTRAVLLDAGAHYGSVTEAFAAQTDGRFAGVLALEPDDANRAGYERFLATIEAETRARIAVSPLALDAQAGERCFHAGLGYASQFSSTGRTMVETTTIDRLCGSDGLVPTFIKLHLEGAELPALKGARRTLARHRPLVAATVYHNDDGLYRTAAYLADTLPQTTLLFRLHGWCGTGAVVYAVPNGS